MLCVQMDIRTRFTIPIEEQQYVMSIQYLQLYLYLRIIDLKTTSANKERGMIFFWQGDGCSINAKGAVAAISIEIDEEGDLHKVG